MAEMTQKMDSQYVYLDDRTENYRQRTNVTIYVRGHDMGSVDYLVLTIILLLSVGISLSRSHIGKSDDDDDQERAIKFRYKISDKKDERWSIRGILGFSVFTAGSIVSPWVNTLCLFSINGEVFRYDTNVVFVFLGMLLSVWTIFLTHYYEIMRENRFKSVAFYFKKRFKAETCSLLVIASSVVKQIIGGALNLHMVSVVVSAITEQLSSIFVSTLVTVSCIACVCASRIHTSTSASFGGIFIWLLGATVIITLIVATVNEGGMSQLFLKAQQHNKFHWPSLSLAPWTSNSLWGNVSIGFFMGFQIFFVSRVTLRCVVEVPKRVLYSTLLLSLIYILLWLMVGVWAGICTSVVFRSSNYAQQFLASKRIDGSLAKIVSFEMEHHRGFRGFFVAALLAASISGLSRRYNQLIGLFHLMFKNFKSKFRPLSTEEDQTTASYILSHPPAGMSEKYLKQLRWEERQRTCCPTFLFKLVGATAFGLLSLWLVWILYTSNQRIWELWVTIIGIMNGPVVGVLLLAILFPFVPHVSAVMGLVMGWMIPTVLAIGNRMLINPVTSLRGGSIKHPTYFESLWERNYLDNSSHGFEQAMIDKFKDPGDIESRNIQYSMFSTSFCYYGIVGVFSTVVTALIFTGLIREWRPSSDVPRNLVHPICARRLRSTAEYVQSRSKGVKLQGKKKKTKMAMSLAQEIVGV